MSKRDRKKEDDSHKRHEDVDAELSSAKELETVRETEAEIAAPAKNGRNVFIGTMNVFSSGARSVGRGVRMVCDPVLKVCYPVAKGIAVPVRTVCDPVLKVCYPPLKTHWETRYKQKFPKHAGWVLALDLSLLFLLGSLVVGLMFVKMVLPAIPQPDVVRMRLLRPATAISGEATTLIISYANESATPLAGAELRVELPEPFVMTDAAPRPENVEEIAAAQGRVRFLRFFIGAVPANGRGEIRIDGTLYGPLGSKHGVASEFLFWKEGGTAPERVAAFHELAITDANFTLGLTFDQPFLRGSRNAVRISYGNQGDEAVADAEIRLSAPAGFRITGAAPPTSTPGIWRLGTLEPGEKGVITVYGVLSESAVPSFVVRAYAGIDGERLLAQEVRGNVDALSTGFAVTHEIVSPAIGAAVRPGESIEVAVRYHNGGKYVLTDAAIRLETTERYLKDSVPAWTGGELARIEPGASGTLTATLRVKDDIPRELLEADPYPIVRVTAVGEYAVEDDPARILRADGGVSEIGVATKLGLEGASLYHTNAGDQLGVGPLPPKVGEPTRLWVVFKVTNGSNAVRDGRLEATLPQGVEWAGRFSVTAGQPLAYLSEQRRIIWEIGNVPAYSDGSDAGASFEISFTPDAEDIGTVPSLVHDIRLTAEDSATSIRVHAETQPVTTAVRFGNEEERSGVVGE